MENEKFGVLVLLQELAVLPEELGFPPAHLHLGMASESPYVPAPYVCGSCGAGALGFLALVQAADVIVILFRRELGNSGFCPNQSEAKSPIAL